ncbi:MAG TPA: prepilin-type N-terminal cleavage/methylation domain-containing protein [Tepidisphaeraceae bacterium]|jgi:general secretion pathway protein G|nr:prepilin-type N-terminal cleavage/methylation domain-containing protein [Tepidisphaeraceae bacterium]
MTAIRKQVRRGFTLVEILIVVIILGILAAIVIPQFTNASQDARKSNMASQLQTLRSQIELFKLQHRDSPPPLASSDEFWSFMTQYSTDDITDAPDNVAGTAAAPKFGPYMQQPAVNPLTNSSTVANQSAATATDGWAYNPATGELHGVAKNDEGVAFITDDGNTVAAPAWAE